MQWVHAVGVGAGELYSLFFVALLSSNCHESRMLSRMLCFECTNGLEYVSLFQHAFQHQWCKQNDL